MSKIEIGTKYRNRKGQECEVVDVLKTYNSRGLLLKTRYAVTHQFCGQSVLDTDVLGTTIKRALAEQVPQ